MSMNILALDAAYGPVSAALIHADGRQWTLESEGNRPHSQTILPLLASLLDQARLDWHQLDGLAVGIGPGSFTGLRVACATLAGLNAVLHKPAIGISSLAITSGQAGIDKDIWVIEDARSGDAYVGHYSGSEKLAEDCCLPWTEVVKMPTSDFVSHSSMPVDLPGWQRLVVRTRRPEALADCVRKAVYSWKKQEYLQYPQPVYLRASQAEIMMQGAQG